METYKIKEDLGGDDTLVEISEAITKTKVNSIADIKKEYAIALEDIEHLENSLEEAKTRANNIVSKLDIINSTLSLGIKDIPVILETNK